MYQRQTNIYSSALEVYNSVSLRIYYTRISKFSVITRHTSPLPSPCVITIPNPQSDYTQPRVLSKNKITSKTKAYTRLPFSETYYTLRLEKKIVHRDYILYNIHIHTHIPRGGKEEIRLASDTGWTRERDLCVLTPFCRTRCSLSLSRLHYTTSAENYRSLIPVAFPTSRLHQRLFHANFIAARSSFNARRAVAAACI